MKQFAVYKNGRIPIRQEAIEFCGTFLGITSHGGNFRFEFDYANEIGTDDTDRVIRLHTDLFSEAEIDSYSMDWEFIDVTEDDIVK